MASKTTCRDSFIRNEHSKVVQYFLIKHRLNMPYTIHKGLPCYQLHEPYVCVYDIRHQKRYFAVRLLVPNGIKSHSYYHALPCYNMDLVVMLLKTFRLSLNPEELHNILKREDNLFKYMILIMGIFEYIDQARAYLNELYKPNRLVRESNGEATIVAYDYNYKKFLLYVKNVDNIEVHENLNITEHFAQVDAYSGCSIKSAVTLKIHTREEVKILDKVEAVRSYFDYNYPIKCKLLLDEDDVFKDEIYADIVITKCFKEKLHNPKIIVLKYDPVEYHEDTDNMINYEIIEDEIIYEQDDVWYDDEVQKITNKYPDAELRVIDDFDIQEFVESLGY